MSMNNLTKVLVCLISQKSLRRPCEQIARVALLAVALIASLSGCARGSVIDMIDHQYNVELVDRLILDDDRDAYLRDEPKSLAFLNDTTLSVATEKGSVLFVDVSDPTDLALIGRFDPGGLPNEAQHVFIVTMDGFAYVSFVARRSDRFEDIGLMVVDARQPAAPELAFELPIEEVYGAVMAAQDNYLYIRNVVGTIEIWDATDPFSLSLAGAYSPPQSRLLPRSKDKEPGFTPPTPRQLAAEKGIGSFMAHKDPELVASQSCTSAGIRGVAVENGFLYLLVNQGGSYTTVCEDGGLWIIDVSSPEEPMPARISTCVGIWRQLSAWLPRCFDGRNTTSTLWIIGGSGLRLPDDRAWNNEHGHRGCVRTRQAWRIRLGKRAGYGEHTSGRRRSGLCVGGQLPCKLANGRWCKREFADFRCHRTGQAGPNWHNHPR